MVLFWMILARLTSLLLARETRAVPCTMTQEPDPGTGRYRWLVPVADPCGCTQLAMGGFSSLAPYRPYGVTYYDKFLVSSQAEEIRQWLNCPGDPSCFEEGPLGMEDGGIPDQSLSASSVWENGPACKPARARLNYTGYGGAWCSGDLDDDVSPWVQVDFDGTVTITGLVTQGRHDYPQWVTEYRVAYMTICGGGQTWHNVTDADGEPFEFSGNSDQSTMVTNHLPLAVRARILRIYPTEWYDHCSMRFEVIGCY